MFAGTIGRSSPDVHFRIADDQGRELPIDAVGELQIKTPFIMNGYLDEPELTHLAFAGDFFRAETSRVCAKRNGGVRRSTRTFYQAERRSRRLDPITF